MVQSQEEEAGSQAFDVILYLFVLGPAVEWCLKSPRVNRGQPGSMRGMALAITLLAALALGKLAYDMAGRDANHFEQLGVRVDASAAEIRKAHKALSLSLHPDKAPDDPRAKEKFLKMQAAYEVLKDASSRDAYNKFGAAGIEDAKSGGNSNSLTSMALFYVIWLVVGYLLTMGKSSEDARTWGFSGLLALAVFEYQTRMLGVDYLAPIFPRSTVHEKVELLHKLFPPFLHGARMISGVVFRDVALYNKMLVEQLLRKQAALEHLAGEVRQVVDAKLGGGGGGGVGGGGGGGDSGAASAVVGGANGTLAAAAAAAGGAPPAPPAQAPAQAEAAPAADAAAAAANSRVTNIVWFFGVYAFFKYVSDKEIW